MARRIKRARLSNISPTPPISSPTRYTLRSQNSSPSLLKSMGVGETAQTSTSNMIASKVAAADGDESLFNNETLSDVLIKFGNQQQIHGHKAVLARRSKYFYKAFSGQFPVATGKEIDLGDDEDPEAIRAMTRHIYDLPYDKMIEENTADDSAAYSTNEDLLFHIAVFTAADKYDVASLRPIVVKKFEDLMETSWESEAFATSIQKLTGPSAGHLADDTLQVAAAAFCAKNLTKLIKQDEFVEMIQKEEPFTGRLLIDFLNNRYIPGEVTTVQLKTCKSNTCRNAKLASSSVVCLATHCVFCAKTANAQVVVNGYYETGLLDYKKAKISFDTAQ
ncbi:hypothetical protein KCU65_g8745, partial [Aureobasidium melanogenum]